MANYTTVDCLCFFDSDVTTGPSRFLHGAGSLEGIANCARNLIFIIFFCREDQERAKHCCQMGWIGYAILQIAKKAVVETQFLAYFCNV